jgi:hypothetical protein
MAWESAQIEIALLKLNTRFKLQPCMRGIAVSGPGFRSSAVGATPTQLEPQPSFKHYFPTFPFKGRA